MSFIRVYGDPPKGSILDSDWPAGYGGSSPPNGTKTRPYRSVRPTEPSQQFFSNRAGSYRLEFALPDNVRSPPRGTQVF